MSKRTATLCSSLLKIAGFLFTCLPGFLVSYVMITLGQVNGEISGGQTLITLGVVVCIMLAWSPISIKIETRVIGDLRKRLFAVVQGEEDKVLMGIRQELAELEKNLARDEDRAVAEYRDRNPDVVCLIDTLRDVLDMLDEFDKSDLLAAPVFRMRTTIERGLTR
jgi:hypothetical protein